MIQTEMRPENAAFFLFVKSEKSIIAHASFIKSSDSLSVKSKIEIVSDRRDIIFPVLDQ